MSNPELIELLLFGAQNILALLGTFSVIAKVTPWDEKELEQKLKNNPDAAKQWLKKVLWVINLLGLAKRIK